MTNTKAVAPIFSENGLIFTAAFASLLLGALIYLFLRPAPVLFVNWLELIGLKQLLQVIRSSTLPLHTNLPQWFVYSLPNGLWTFAYALIMTRIWWGRKTVVSYFWLGTIPLLGAGYESLQYLGLIPGTFCPYDLLLGFLGASLGFILVARNMGRCGNIDSSRY